MLIALISDIHANLPALKAALEDAASRGAERFLCAGDLTGYGPFPSEVCRLLWERDIPAILGNYDEKALAAIRNPADLRKKMKPGKWKILDWTRTNLDKQARAYLASLPLAHRETLPRGVKVLVVHGSPLSIEDTVYPSITSYGLKAKLAGEKPDVFVCGHTHIPFVKRVGGVLVVNCGSTGHPVDGDPRPSYAMVRIEAGRKPTGRIIRFDYPKKEVIQAIGRSLLPKGLSKDFMEGNKKRWIP